MIITNAKELGTSELRCDALAILEAGYAAIDTETVLGRAVFYDGRTLTVQEKKYDLSAHDRVLLIGIGKCAADAAVVLERMLGERIGDGVIVDVRGVPLARVHSVAGTHPLPSEQNIAAARSIKELLESAGEHDLILAVISGGGSALLCLPHDMSCETLRQITDALMKKGASIEELNIVRKHLSDILGGQFAKLAYPAHIVSLIFSDVPGDDLGTIASGPTVRDTSTKEDAEEILARYDVLTVCKLPECEIVETPKEAQWFEHVDNFLLLTNMIALEAMAAEAQVRGYDAEIVEHAIEGEAREVGARLTQEAHADQKNSGGGKHARFYGGETTVTVRGGGTGGRNQELVLGGLIELAQGADMHPQSTVLVAAASDGWDNSDTAGALADETTFRIAKDRGVDPLKFLESNNSYEFFEQCGGHITTGRRGTNVSDLYFSLTQ